MLSERATSASASASAGPGERRSAELASGEVAYLLAAGEVQAAVESLVEKDCLRDALVVATAHGKGRFSVDRGDAKEGAASEDLAEWVALCTARHHLEAAAPLLACAVCVGAGLMGEAVRSLVRGLEVEAALALVQCLGSNHPDLLALQPAAVGWIASRRAAQAGDRALAIQLAEEASRSWPRSGLGPWLDAQLLAAHLGSSRQVDSSKRGAPPARSMEEVREAQDRGDWARAVRVLLANHFHAEAAALLIRRGGVLEELAAKWDWRDALELSARPTNRPQASEQVLVAAGLVSFLDLGALQGDRELASTLYGWACWLGAVVAEASPDRFAGLDPSPVAHHLYR